jgi:hypothetical protein
LLAAKLDLIEGRTQMLELLMIAAGLFVAWLLRKAFQGRCEAAGVSEGYGAWLVIKWLVIATVGGFIGLVLLAMYLSHLNAAGQ